MQEGRAQIKERGEGGRWLWVVAALLPPPPFSSPLAAAGCRYKRGMEQR